MDDPIYTDDEARLAASVLYAAGADMPNTWSEAVLEAVLPFYRKRILNELADHIDKWGISGVIGNAYVINWLRHMGEEECPDCGMRGLHAVDHGMSWPKEPNDHI
jgi:hypothetical protein